MKCQHPVGRGPPGSGRVEILVSSGHWLREPTPLPDAGLGVPDQSTRHRTELLDQLHEPNNRSSVFRVGIIRAVTNLENAATITNTGDNTLPPSSSGIFRGGNHRSHCAASPAAQCSRSAGSTGAMPQQRPHLRLERRERRFPWPSLIFRWSIRRHRRSHRLPRDAEVLRDLTLRNPVREQPPDQRQDFGSGG